MPEKDKTDAVKRLKTKRKGLKSKVQASAGGAKKWATLRECLAGAEKEGLKISERKAREHYGAGASRPIRRNKKGQWAYHEFLERVRQNASTFESTFTEQTALTIARQRARNRIEELRVACAEMELARRRGQVVDMGLVQKVWTEAAEGIKAGDRMIEDALPKQLVGLGEEEIRVRLAAANREKWQHLHVKYSEGDENKAKKTAALPQFLKDGFRKGSKGSN